MSRLQDIREAAGLSRTELAKAAEVKVRTLTYYEEGYRDINGVAGLTLKKLADVLKCRIEDLLEPKNDTK